MAAVFAPGDTEEALAAVVLVLGVMACVCMTAVVEWILSQRRLRSVQCKRS